MTLYLLLQYVCRLKIVSKMHFAENPNPWLPWSLLCLVMYSLKFNETENGCVLVRANVFLPGCLQALCRHARSLWFARPPPRARAAQPLSPGIKHMAIYPKSKVSWGADSNIPAGWPNVQTTHKPTKQTNKQALQITSE